MLCCFPSALSGQQTTGIVVGRITDASTGQPIDGAQVVVMGTNRGVVSNLEGAYRIPGAPAGERQIRVINIGYAQAVRTVTVEAGAAVTLDFALEPTALELDAIVVNAAGRATLKREIGSKVGVIDVGELELTPVRSFSDLIQAREPGVTVVGSGGTAGTGSRIRIRGSNSVSLSNSPLLIVDGVRVDDNPNAYELFTGGVTSSRLDDLNPEDIESIEILKGPSAAALYGTAAASGVIQVTTKRGHAGDSSWRVWAEGSAVDRNVTMPDNVWAVDALGDPCSLLAQLAAFCTSTEILRFNPLENEATTAFRTGWGQTYGASVSGGSEAMTFYVSGEFAEETGSLEENSLEQVNLRANLTGQIKDNLRISTGAAYLNHDAQYPQNDNSGLGILLNALIAPPHPVVIDEGGYRLPREYLFAWDNFQNLQRSTLTGSLDWQPLEWLTLNATGGLDDVDQHDNGLVEPNVLTLFGPPFSIGLRESVRQNVVNYTATGSATASYRPMPDLDASTSAGVQYFRDRTQGVFATGAGITPGTGSLSSATTQFLVDEFNIENILLGTFLSQQVAWRELVFLNAAVRGDRNSAFGLNLGWIWYPSVSASWLLSEETFFPELDWLDDLRIRAAWGESGLRPTFRQAKQFFDGVTAVNQDGTEEPGFAVSGAGNPDLEPQRSTEVEVGFEAGLVDGRVGLDVTWYSKDSKNDIITAPLPPSAGASADQARNLGLMRNRGFEIGLNVDAVRGSDLALSFRASLAHNDNELKRFDQEPIDFGLLGTTQRHEEGYPAGGYWQLPIESYADANGDGLIDFGEVEVGDEPVFLGEVFPSTLFSLGTSVDVRSWLRVSALLDYQGGHHQLNITSWTRCEGPFATCAERHDPQASLFEQARAVAWEQSGTVAGYIEEADFWKLREVSATLRLPTRWLQNVYARDVALTLEGRNLFTWTDYTGFDPEVNGAAQANFETNDNTTLPSFRTLIVRLDVSF
jgi:TonB-linked SusC/RagA family outer membrane protein